jgi:hypothetical protein
LRLTAYQIVMPSRFSRQTCLEWNRSLTSPRKKLIKIGAKVVSQGRCIIFQMAQIAMSWQMFRAILSVIARFAGAPRTSGSGPGSNTTGNEG